MKLDGQDSTSLYVFVYIYDVPAEAEGLSIEEFVAEVTGYTHPEQIDRDMAACTAVLRFIRDFG